MKTIIIATSLSFCAAIPAFAQNGSPVPAGRAESSQSRGPEQVRLRKPPRCAADARCVFTEQGEMKATVVIEKATELSRIRP
jgi:hypothetical protein